MLSIHKFSKYLFSYEIKLFSLGKFFIYQFQHEKFIIFLTAYLFTRTTATVYMEHAS